MKEYFFVTEDDKKEAVVSVEDNGETIVLYYDVIDAHLNDYTGIEDLFESFEDCKEALTKKGYTKDITGLMF